VLSVEIAVVRRIGDQRVVELPLRPQRPDDLAHTIVHRQQRFQPAPVLAPDAHNLTRVEQFPTPDLHRLVGDVRLVEVRGPRQPLGVERVRVPGRRLRGAVVAVERPVRIPPRAAKVRRRVREPEEEGLRLRCPVVDEADGLSSQHVLFVVGGPLAAVDQSPIVVQRVVIEPVRLWGGRVPVRPAQGYGRAV
jgi:hypothetical protein